MLPFKDKSNINASSKCNCNGSAIIFLQRKQTEILSELHNEISSLKRENSDLKFSIFTKSAKDDNGGRTKKQEKLGMQDVIKGDELKFRISKLTKELEEERFQVNALQLTLASMTKMLEASNFLHTQVESQSHDQQIEIRVLQRKLEELNQLNDLKFVLPISSKKCHTSRSSYEDEQQLTKRKLEHQRRRSLSTSYPTNNQRRSSLSILPTDYKESVSTLPPIGFTGTVQNGACGSEARKMEAYNNSKYKTKVLASSSSSRPLMADLNPFTTTTTTNNISNRKGLRPN